MQSRTVGEEVPAGKTLAGERLKNIRDNLDPITYADPVMN